MVASFGAEELTWLRAAARGFYRKYVSRSEKNELWPHRPFVLRVDGMDFSDAETVFTTSKEGELNYRRFKRCIAEDVVRKSLDKLAPPRRLNGKSEPWAVPNRVEVRRRRAASSSSASAAGGAPNGSAAAPPRCAKRARPADARLPRYLCGNQISDVPRHRRDVAPVIASARWRGGS